MDLRHLRSFQALAEERHFGRAAARLHLAQPALSQQVKQLERELGVTLFTRTTRRVELTEAGLRFGEHARTVLGDVARAEDDMALLASGASGRVSVGFIGTATYDVLPRVAREVRAALPDIELELRGELLSPQLVAGLADRTFDIALVRPDPQSDRDLSITPLRTERLVAVLPAAHPLAGRRRIPLSALAGSPFVMHPSGHRSSMHARVLAACEAAGFTPPSMIEVGETATLVVFVAAGLGVALVPEPVRSLGLDGVSYVALSNAPTIDLAIATRADDDSPAVRRVATIIGASV
ncbi:LysR family transcriptional regulator [Nocardioides sp. Root1257]|uniref:LysR substrate-binding domain-containing protein n=1 Tax=unclassified Nocardioides TaxID=2615069 RepID=UPI00070137FB|nr:MULTISPECIES: LysR substrate-binding domain-containing protein [unclassified Nocardioides]KQW47358.1 LysR family transcriptional regulator [Nocardioides sp. Root1257]KRC45514.1 LysR family transcriptional regulator [Nocardioides sp. Root224]